MLVSYEHLIVKHIGGKDEHLFYTLERIECCDADVEPSWYVYGCIAAQISKGSSWGYLRVYSFSIPAFGHTRLASRTPDETKIPSFLRGWL